MSSLLAGQKCSGVSGRESGDPELNLMQFCGYDRSSYNVDVLNLYRIF